jgi:DNA-binding LacI/PurR family transcriptional regulator
VSAVEVPRRKPTLFDVALLAGVSHMTVSRFLRADPTIRSDNRARIASAIAELQYRPNLIARSMRERQHGLLAVLIPATVNSYSPARIVSAATLLAHEQGYEVEVVSVEGGAAARTRRALELADSRLVEGVVSFASLDEDSFAGARAPDVPVIADVNYDDVLQGIGPLLDATPITTIVERLAELGHRNFFHVGGPRGHPAADERHRAYSETTARLGLADAGVWRQDWYGASGERAATALSANSGVTAIVCANDELAAGVIKGASSRGWSVPADISVTGWDDSPIGAYMPPGLTTVHVDHALLGRRAMGRLIALLRGDAPAAEDRFPLNSVIWRRSIGPCRKPQNHGNT